MSRMIKRLICLPLLLWAALLLTGAASAEKAPLPAEEAPDVYEELFREQMEAGGAAGAFEGLPEETRQYFYEFGLDFDSYDGLQNLDSGSVFKTLLRMVSQRISGPFLGALSVIAMVLLGSLAKNFGAPAGENQITEAFHYVSVLAAGASILLPLMGTVQAVQKTIQTCGIFIAGFVPVFAGILIAAGKISTAAGFSALLLFAAQAVAQTAAGVVTPLTGMFFALSVSAQLGPGLSVSGFSDSLRKAGTYLLTFLLTVFLGILSIQTAIGSATDTLTARTAKFFVGSFVPVVGNALGEAVGAVGASLSLVRSTVGIYALIAVFLLMIPAVLELALWRLTILLARSAAELFDQKKLASMLGAAGNALSFLFALLVLVGVMFIISLAVVISISSKSS